MRKDNREIWFPSQQPGLLWAALPAMERVIEPRLIFQEKGGRRFADCRGLQKYRLPFSDTLIELPFPPEAGDIFAGYFAKGRPAEGETVFDAGAYGGEASLVMARLVGPSGRVFAFEPDPGNCAQLRKNVAAAKLTNVTVIERGLWKETTELVFSATSDVGACAVDDEAAARGPTIRVPVVSFQEACALAGAVPDFVKMDIEGAEIETLEGAGDFLRAHAIRFSIASYHLRDGVTTSLAVERMLRSAGYEVETGFPEHLTTWAWKKK